MKKIILFLLTLSALNATSTTCKSLYYDLEMKSAEYSQLADSTDNKTMMSKVKSLQKDIRSYNLTCCKSQECKDEMTESMYELEETELALIVMMKGKK